jgi:hypothetical protein
VHEDSSSSELTVILVQYPCCEGGVVFRVSVQVALLLRTAFSSVPANDVALSHAGLIVVRRHSTIISTITVCITVSEV